MKILLTFLLLSSLVSYGQFEKGDKYLGGTIDFHTQRAPTSQNGGLANLVNSFSIYPSVGFLLNDRVSVGAQIGYSSFYSKNTNFSSYISEYKSFSIASGIFVRRYLKISDKFLFSTIGLVNFSRSSSRNTDTNTITNTINESNPQSYQLSSSIRPNFIFFPSQNWGFEATVGSIGYTLNRNLSTGEKSNLFHINYGPISFGLSYYLRNSD